MIIAVMPLCLRTFGSVRTVASLEGPGVQFDILPLYPAVIKPVNVTALQESIGSSLVSGVASIQPTSRAERGMFWSGRKRRSAPPPG